MAYFTKAVLLIVLIMTLLLIGSDHHFFFKPADSRIPKYKGGLIITDPHLKAQVIADGLDFPTSMAFLGPDDILVLEKDKGTVQRIINGTMLPKPLLDVNVANSHERGMLGIAVSKNENENGNVNSSSLPTYVFLYYTETQIEGSDVCPKPNRCEPGHDPLGNRLYRYELINNTLHNPKLLLDLPADPIPTHNGGKIVIGPDDNVYLIIGDLNQRSGTQNFPNKPSTNGTSAIYRISQEGKVVKPILGDKDPLNKYYAYGIRNSFGIDFDPVTGKLWDTENGAAYGDEINLVEPGFNSGWRKIQGIWETKGTTSGGNLVLNSTGFKQKIMLNISGLEDFGGNGKYSPPEFIWFNNSAPTAIKFLSSDKLGKEYENDIFVGDYNGGNVYHFELNQNRTGFNLSGPLADKIEDSPEELKDIIFAQGFGSITDLQVGPDGYLYVLSFDEGKIYKIVPTSLNSTLQNSISTAKPSSEDNQTTATITVRNSRPTATLGGPVFNDPRIDTEIVADGVDFPTSMAFLGPDDILVLEKNKGTVQRIINGTMLPKPLLDVNVANSHERGMLGIAVSKNENGNVNSSSLPTYVFLYYTESSVGKDSNDNTATSGLDPLGNRLYRYELIDNKLVNPKLLLDLPASPPPERANAQNSHMGGKVLIGPDQNVYLGIGNVGGHRTQSENVFDGPTPDRTGGILKITQEGHVAPNPPLGMKHPLDIYYAYGIRNTFGMDFDPLTGILWDTENGPTYSDEINIVQPGFNSGWEKAQGMAKDRLTGKVKDSSIDLVDFNGTGIYSDPEFVWNTPIAPTAIKFLSSDKLGKQYENSIFIGDANLGYLYNFRLNQQRTGLLLDNNGPLEDRVADTPDEIQETVFGRGFGAITDIQSGPDGGLYVLSLTGSIYRISLSSSF